MINASLIFAAVCYFIAVIMASKGSAKRYELIIGLGVVPMIVFGMVCLLTRVNGYTKIVTFIASL